MISQRLLRFHYFIFILFFPLFSSPVVISITLSSNSLICSSASVILILSIFTSRVFFTSVLVLFVSVFCGSVHLSLCYTLLVSSQSLNPFFIARSWIIFSIITLNPFWIHCWSEIQLISLLGFYLTPSPETYSSVISFCITFCDCSFCSVGYSIVVFLASAICPLERLHKRLCRISCRRNCFTSTGG